MVVCAFGLVNLPSVSQSVAGGSCNEIRCSNWGVGRTTPMGLRISEAWAWACRKNWWKI